MYSTSTRTVGRNRVADGGYGGVSLSAYVHDNHVQY